MASAWSRSTPDDSRARAVLKVSKMAVFIGNSLVRRPAGRYWEQELRNRRIRVSPRVELDGEVGPGYWTGR